MERDETAPRSDLSEEQFHPWLIVLHQSFLADKMFQLPREAIDIHCPWLTSRAYREAH
jgi:hypothetical protein